MDVDVCQICEGVVNFVDEKLKEPDTTTEIDALLENICTLMPQSSRQDVS